MAHQTKQTILYLDLMLTDGFARDNGVELPDNIVWMITLKWGTIKQMTQKVIIKMHYHLTKHVFLSILDGLPHGFKLRFVWSKAIPLNEDVFLSINHIPQNVIVKFIWTARHIPLQTIQTMQKHQQTIMQTQWIEIRDHGHTILAQQRSNIVNPSIPQSTAEQPKHIVFRTHLHHSIKYKLCAWLKPNKLLNRGNSAICEVTDTRNQKKYAVKKYHDIFIDIADARRLLKEIQLMRLFDHPCIMSLTGVIPPTDEEGNLFSDVCTIIPKYDTDLAKVLRSKQLTEKHMQYFIYQIGCGLQYMHSAGVTHHSLKPQHILVNAADCKIKITDFAFACVDGVKPYSRWANVSVYRWYKAPEIFFDGQSPASPKSPSDSIKAGTPDVWSLGCIAAEFFSRKPFFRGNTYLEQLQLIFRYLGTPTEIDWIKAPDAKKWIKTLLKRPPIELSPFLPGSTACARDFIQSLLVINPHQRPSATEVLKHKWLKKLYREKHDRQCPPLNTYDGFEKRITTAFGVRHMIYQELNDFHCDVIEKQKMDESNRKENNIEIMNAIVAKRPHHGS
eukprot:529305_1